MTHRERHKLFKEGFVDKQVANHHQHHNSDIDQFAKLLEDKLEEFAQSQEAPFPNVSADFTAMPEPEQAGSFQMFDNSQDDFN